MFANKTTALFPNQFVNTRLLVEYAARRDPDSNFRHPAQRRHIVRVRDSEQDGPHLSDVKPGVTDSGMTQVKASIPET